MRAYRKLPAPLRARTRKALEKLADDLAHPGRVSGKRSKTLSGTRDTFHRLRVGDHRIMYDVLVEERTVLVLGIVHRGDLVTWLRTKR